MPAAISANGLKRKGDFVPAAGTGVILKLVDNPAAAIASIATPIFHGSSPHLANRNAPAEVPITIAANVTISSKAFARERSCSGTISGTRPYFAGLKTVARKAIRNNTRSIHSIRGEKNAAMPNPSTRTSNAFTPIKIRRLLTASARWPEYPENNRNGITKAAPVSARYSLLDPVAAAMCTARRDTIIL